MASNKSKPGATESAAATVLSTIPSNQAPRFAPVLEDGTVAGSGQAVGLYDPSKAAQGTGDTQGTIGNHAYGDSDHANRAILGAADDERSEAQGDMASVQQGLGAQMTVTQADPDAGFLYVVDRTADHVSGNRTHELYMADGVKKPFTFEPFEPKRLPFEIAVRFLKSEGFALTDRQGNERPFRKTPKRPEELQAGEKLTVGADETIARFDELTDDALVLRAAQLPGSEIVVREGPRSRVIKFMIDFYAGQRRANTSNDMEADGFTPPPETDY